jgi:hypothetical protein
MEIDTLHSRAAFTRSGRNPYLSASSYDFQAIMRKIKNTTAWENGELNAEILMNCPTKKMVLTVMHDMTEVQSYQSGDSVTIQVTEGKIKFHSSVETVILSQGQLLVLCDKMKFSLTALEESSFLLTILTGSHSSKGN